jgi:Peptidase family S41
VTSPRFARLRRVALQTARVVAIGLLGFVIWERVSFDRDAWLADYAQLRTHVAVHYANLLWVIDARGLDPVALDHQTLQALHDADTDREARAAIVAFVEAFDDGHFRINRIKLSKRLAAWWGGLWVDAHAEVTPPDSTTPGPDACTRLGFHEDAGGLEFGLLGAPGFTPLPAADRSFAAGTLVLDERRLGILRIPIFDQQRYRSACIRAWDGFREGLEGACDEGCIDHFVHLEVPNRLLAELTATVHALAEAGMDALVVDITHNGGGTDWVDPAARIVSTRPLTCPRLAFIRHPHWSERLTGVLREVEDDLQGDRSAEDRALLQDARTRLQHLVAEAQQPCDLSTIWTDPVRPACTNLVEDEYYACGVFPHVPPGSLVGATSRDSLWKALRYAYTPGQYDGPLYVLVDNHTGSAAEYFAAMLADNEAAVLLGQLTAASGCGYTNGGVPARLQHSELRVDMPDCQRRRRNGDNELAGIAPHVEIDWTPQDDVTTRREKLLAALRTAL